MSDFDFAALAPERSLVFLPCDGQFQQDVGANLLTNPGFEAGLVGWIQGTNVILSTSGDVHSGSLACNVHANAGTNSGAYQVIAAAGQVLHVGGWAKGPSLALRSGISLLKLFSPAVVYALREAIVTMPSVHLGFTAHSAGSDALWDDTFAYDHPRVTRSLSLGDALNYARLGDGHVLTTMPTQLPGGRGMSFDGGDWVDLDWAAGGALDTQTFTVCALVNPTTPAADGRIYEIGIAGQRYSLYYDLGAGTIVWQKDDTVDQTITSGYGGTEFGQPFVVAASISPLGMKLQINDRVMGEIAGDVRLASFDAASKAYFGQDAAGGNLFKGDMLSAAVSPFQLSTAQVMEWGRRARQAGRV